MGDQAQRLCELDSSHHPCSVASSPSLLTARTNRLVQLLTDPELVPKVFAMTATPEQNLKKVEKARKNKEKKKRNRNKKVQHRSEITSSSYAEPVINAPKT